jgi:hypothetical protein
MDGTTRHLESARENLGSVCIRLSIQKLLPRDKKECVALLDDAMSSIVQARTALTSVKRRRV